MIGLQCKLFFLFQSDSALTVVENPEGEEAEMEVTVDPEEEAEEGELEVVQPSEEWQTLKPGDEVEDSYVLF